MSGAPDNTDSTEKKACIHGDPPQLTVTLPSTEDVTAATRHRDDAPLPVDVLLLAVKECEFLACYSQLVKPYRCWFKNVGYVYFEDTSDEKVKVALITCYEGAGVPGGALMTVKNAAAELRPKAVIAVGACSSLNPHRANLGDVVVSSKVTTYASKVVKGNQEQSTGMRSYVSGGFLKIIKHAPYGFKAPLQDLQAHKIKVHCDGEFLSGPEVVCAEWRRKELAERHPRAIAIETEGEGLFTAAFDGQIEWLIVKGIADYADGDELTTERWSPFASVMAVSVVQHLLRNPEVFRTWPNYHCEDATDPSSHHDSNPTREKEAKLPSEAQAPQCTEAMVQTDHLTECASLSAHIVEWIRQIYERREGQVLPVPWCEDLSFHLKDIFTGLRIVGREKTRGTLTRKVINMTGIFTPHSGCQTPQIVLLEAEPGMGKTTYCQKLAYDWATKQDHEWDESFPKIEVLLLLRCRDIKFNIWEAIEEQILPEEVDEKAKQIFFQFIRENPSKVLLVLDGLDEVDPNKQAMYVNLLERKQLPGCHIVLSSRHEAGKNVRRYCDTLWEIVGFTRKRAEHFIRKYFQNMEHLSEKLIKKLWPWQREDGDGDKDDNDDDDDDLLGGGLVALMPLTRNPLHLTLLCIIFEDMSGILPDERAQLFMEIVNCILRRYEEKNGLSSNKKDLIPVYEKELVLLGCKALQCLREGVFHFEENEGDLSVCGLMKFGFLSIQAGGSKRVPCIRYGFPHKSFQEFFAGLYLAFQLRHGKIDCDSVVTDERYLAELNEVFVFMSGIIASQCEVTMVSLLNSIVAHVNFLGLTLQGHASHANFSKYLSFTAYYISECMLYNKKSFTLLACNLGKTLSLTSLHFGKEFDCRWLDPLLGTLYLALEVNSTLTNLNLGGNRIDDEGAHSLSQALTVNSTLTNLNLRGNRIGDKGAHSLSQALKVNSTLTNLDLHGNSIGDEGAHSLSQALTVNSTLTNLDLGGNSIGDEGAHSLSQALKVNSTLTNLNLAQNSIGGEGAHSLSQALTVNSTLSYLDLGCNGIGAEGAHSLSQSLKINSTLTNLDLCGNSIGDEGAHSLSQALKVNSTLANLDLCGNSIGDEGAYSLSEALTVNSTLTNLSLAGSNIGAEGVHSLSQALTVNSTLTNLDLGFSCIGDEGAHSLSQALTVNSTLTNLDLGWNRIGAKGAHSLSQALKVNSTLTNLSLSWNPTFAEGAHSLSQTLKVNSTLTNLNLWRNCVGGVGAHSLSQALKVNSTLTNLNLGENRTGAKGVDSLSQALTVNSTLTNLDLGGNSIGDKGAHSLSQALKVNSTLTNLNLGQNGIGDEGAHSLSQALKVNSTLTDLDFVVNCIGSQGATSLSQALKENSTLTNLHLGYNRIGDEGSHSLSQALKVNSTLTNLHLRWNVY